MISAISAASRSSNSGTRATMLQVTTKSRRWISSREGGRDDADRQRQHDDAHHGREAGDDLAERRDRHDVAVADGRQGDDRPLHRVRDRAELVGLRVALDEMHARRGHGEHGAAEDDDARERAPGARLDRLEQRGQAGRIAGELEEAQQPEAARARAGRRLEEREHRTGRIGEEVDDRPPGCAPKPQRAAPRRNARRAACARRRSRAEAAYSSVNTNDARRSRSPGRPCGSAPRARHRFEDDRGDVDEDERDAARCGRRGSPDGRRTGRARGARRPCGAGGPHASAGARGSSVTRPRAPLRPRRARPRPARRRGRRPGPCRGRPPPPLPPSFSAPARTRLTASSCGGEVVGDADHDAGLAVVGDADDARRRRSRGASCPRRRGS